MKTTIEQSVIEYFTLKALLLSILTVGLYTAYLALDRHNRSFTKDDKGIRFEYGILSKTSIFLKKDKIEEVLIKKSLIGRMLNLGTIVISTNGNNDNMFNYIVDVDSALLF